LLSTVTVPAVPLKIAKPSCTQVPLARPLASVQLSPGLPARQVPVPPAILPSLKFALLPPSQRLSTRPSLLIRLTWFATEVCTASLFVGAVPMSRPLSVSVPV
jgi:hypothetical protein